MTEKCVADNPSATQFHVGVSLAHFRFLFRASNGLSSGHETTAGALTWALYALTLHPEIQSRLRQEIQAQLHSESPSFGDLEGLNFLNNFTKEVLRYYPPGMFFKVR
jgi:cytochrome P450